MSAMALPTDIEPMVLAVRDAALQLVQDERGVRVEDYVTVLAAAAGEATLVDADLFDIEANDLTPGAGVFGDAINVVLTGDGSEAGGIPTTSTVGVLVDQLVQMKRCGFSEAVLRADQDRTVGERLLQHFSGFYQGDATDLRPHFAKAA